MGGGYEGSEARSSKDQNFERGIGYNQGVENQSRRNRAELCTGRIASTGLGRPPEPNLMFFNEGEPFL